MAEERVREFYNLVSATTTAYDYSALLSSIQETLSAIGASASNAADASSNAIPSQIQSMETLQTTLAAVSANRSQLESDFRTTLGLNETLTQTTDGQALASKGLLLNLANEQALIRTMEGQLSTIIGAMTAIAGNADYYRASGAVMGQLASESIRVSTALQESQLNKDPTRQDWSARREAVSLACQAAHAAVNARLPMLAQLSRTMVTTAGRDTTPPGLMIPAWDSSIGNYADTNMPLPSNLWDPDHQVVMTGGVYTGGSSSFRGSYMNQAWSRWTASNSLICRQPADGPGSSERLVFHLKKLLTGEDLQTFLTKGWVTFPVNFSDWRRASASTQSISPSVARRMDGEWSALVSAPVVWNVAYQGCTGINDTTTDKTDPCCERSGGCTTPLLDLPEGTELQIVRTSAAWVPTLDSNCDTASAAVEINPYLVDSPRPAAANQPFPVATQTCQSSIMVPGAYQAINDVSYLTLARVWAFQNSAEVCASTGVEGFTFTPIRGIPLLGQWALATTSSNARVIARAAFDTDPITAPAATFASNNSNIKAVRILYGVMAEPKATLGPAVYNLLASAPAQYD